MAVGIPAYMVRLITPDGEIIPGSAALQGTWSVEQYLRLTAHTNRLFEFSDGELEILPSPTDKHQVIIAFLYRALFPLLERAGGVILFAALRLQIGGGKFREPDLMLLLDANDLRRDNRYWKGADLVIEVVSEDDPERDTVIKRAEYARGGIPEYWIINPADETIMVLQLGGVEDSGYTEYGVFRRGQVATSPLLPDFRVQVSDIYDAR